MISSKQYIPKGLVTQELYQKICESIDEVISENEAELTDILEKWKNFDLMSGDACKATLTEMGFDSIIRILDLPDTTAARLAYFLNAITFLKGHKEGLILVTRLLGGSAIISEWFDYWEGYSDTVWTVGTPYNINDTIRQLCAADLNVYLYKCTQTGNSGAVIPVFTQFLGDVIPDNTCEWENVGKPQIVKVWEPNTVFEINQHVYAPYFTRIDNLPTPDATMNVAPISNSPFPPSPRPVQGKQYIYTCIVPGTTDPTPPVFPTTSQAGFNTVAEAIGGVTWTCLNPEQYFHFNMAWIFPPTGTTPHTIDYFREFVRSYVYPVLNNFTIASTISFMFSMGNYWQTNLDVKFGNIIFPSTGHYHIPGDSTPVNAFYYKCTTPLGGTTGAGVEPVWPLVAGHTVLDNGLTWECRTIYPQLGLGFDDLTIPGVGGTLAYIY